MRKIILFFLLVLSNYVYSQSDPNKTLQALFEENKFQEVISEKNKYNEDEFDDKTLYEIGRSFFYLEDFNSAMSYFEKAYLKDPEFAAITYYIGLCYLFMNNENKALEKFNEAIAISENKQFYIIEKIALLDETNRKEEAFALADSIYKADTALYTKGYFYLAKLYLLEKNDSKTALEILNEGKSKKDTENDFYLSILDMIGILEAEDKNYTVSNENLIELIKLDSTIYKAYPYIIRNYFALGNHDDASPYRKILYDAYEKGLLTDIKGLRKEYRFDEFKWKNYDVLAYETFAFPDPEKEYPFYKQTYYVYRENSDSLEFTIQTELLFGTGGDVEPIYVLGKSLRKDGVYYHATYGTLNFKEPVDYKKLKEGVLKVLNEEVSPTSSSTKKINK
ncbi:MAG TPA: hypothetical protein VHP32_05440 [Ignavibacteria bacterium]|nr:hypothetical protein [Ignavibacteria bacterium]